MRIKKTNKEYIRFKLAQARDAYEEAQGLFANGADLGYVLNSLYYAFYYPVLALLHSRDIPAAMQSVSIALFEKEFVETGLFEKHYYEALRRAFDLKPKCSSGELKMITRSEIEMLLAEAREFLDAVERKTAWYEV
ncbi:MAG TPA: HEPN domain-containing protein [Nitrospirota bacterium]|nr:HEPN domain-containing protein [Nitrospirota bacterium]